MKKIMKRMFALLLAMVLVAGMVPHFAVEAEAASEPITLEGESFNANPGQGFVFDVYYQCYTCKNIFRADSADDQHSLEIVNFSYKIAQGECIWNITTKIKNCRNGTVSINFTNEASYNKKTYNCTSSVDNKYIWIVNESNLNYYDEITVSVKRDATEHQGDATCHEAKNCTLCNTSYYASHSYDAWLPSANNPEQHYRVCQVTECGDVNTGSHTWGDWSFTETAHSGTCTLCRYTENGEHSATGENMATCQKKATCDICGQEYGSLADHDLEYDTFGDFRITQECKKCSHNAVAARVQSDGIDWKYTGLPYVPYYIFYGYGKDNWVGEEAVLTYENNINAGTNTAKCTISAGGVTFWKLFSIEKRPLDDEAVILSGDLTSTYTGSNQTVPPFTLTLNDKALVEGVDYTVQTPWPTEIKNVGTYTTVLEGMGNFKGTRTVTYTIGKAEPTFTAPTAKELTYTGKAQALVNPGSTPVGKIQYSLTQDGEYSTDIPKGTDASDYTVWYKAVVPEDNANYKSSTPACVEVTIAKAEPTVAAPTAITGLVYNGQEQELVEASITGGTEGTFTYEMNGQNAQPTGKDAGEYEVTWIFTPTDTDNYKVVTGTEPISVTIAKAPLTLSIDGLPAEGKITKVYDGTTDLPEGHGLSIAVSGAQGSDIPTITGQLAYASADAGETAIRAEDITLDEAYTTNYKLTNTGVSADVGEITPRPIGDLHIGHPLLTWTGEEQEVEFDFLENDQLLEGVTYTATDNKVTGVGNYTATVTGTGNYTGTEEVVFQIMPDSDILEGIDERNVTSAHQKTIDKAKEMVDTAETDGLTEGVIAELKTIGDKAKALEDKLDAAMDAAATEDIAKGQSITRDNAKVTDKKALQDAKADLTDALNTYGTNYTAEEKKAINDEIARIEKVLADIATAEGTAKTVADLPVTVKSDNAADWDKVNAAQEAYDKLTDEQKKIVDNSTSGKLAKHQATIRTIKVEKISATKWYKGSKKDITITYDGPYSKFDHLEVNGKELDAKHYTKKEGSTVITLKESYLETLTSRKSYDVVAVFEGDVKSEAATFTVYKSVSNSATGDQFNVGLWAGIGGISIVALIAVLILMKKKK